MTTSAAPAPRHAPLASTAAEQAIRDDARVRAAELRRLIAALEPDIDDPFVLCEWHSTVAALRQAEAAVADPAAVIAREQRQPTQAAA